MTPRHYALTAWFGLQRGDAYQRPHSRCHQRKTATLLASRHSGTSLKGRTRTTYSTHGLLPAEVAIGGLSTSVVEVSKEPTDPIPRIYPFCHHSDGRP